MHYKKKHIFITSLQLDFLLYSTVVLSCEVSVLVNMISDTSSFPGIVSTALET